LLAFFGLYVVPSPAHTQKFCSENLHPTFVPIVESAPNTYKKELQSSMCSYTQAWMVILIVDNFKPKDLIS